MGAAARLRDEAFSPIKATTWLRVISLDTTEAASVGSLWSSSAMRSRRLPRTPPPRLISSTARRAPLREESAYVASGPVKAPKKPSSIPLVSGGFSPPQARQARRESASARRITGPDSMRTRRGPHAVEYHDAGRLDHVATHSARPVSGLRRAQGRLRAQDRRARKHSQHVPRRGAPSLAGDDPGYPPGRGDGLGHAPLEAQGIAGRAVRALRRLRLQPTGLHAPGPSDRRHGGTARRFAGFRERPLLGEGEGGPSVRTPGRARSLTRLRRGVRRALPSLERRRDRGGDLRGRALRLSQSVQPGSARGADPARGGAGLVERAKGIGLSS